MITTTTVNISFLKKTVEKTFNKIWKRLIWSLFDIIFHLKSFSHEIIDFCHLPKLQIVWWYLYVVTIVVGNSLVTPNNSGMSDEALLLTCSLGHVSGWFETKNSALEANQATCLGGCFTRRDYKGKYQIYVKLCFEALNIIFNDFEPQKWVPG